MDFINIVYTKYSIKLRVAIPGDYKIHHECLESSRTNYQRLVFKMFTKANSFLQSLWSNQLTSIEYIHKHFKSSWSFFLSAYNFVFLLAKSSLSRLQTAVSSIENHCTQKKERKKEMFCCQKISKICRLSWKIYI